MNCPKCSYQKFEPNSPCPSCSFQGNPELLEKLSNIIFILGQISSWTEIPIKQRGDLHKRYSRQRRDVERSLGILPPILDRTEATTARTELKKIDYLLRAIPAFFNSRGINIPQEIIDELYSQAEDLRKGLQDAPHTPELPKIKATLVCYRFLESSVESWLLQGKLTETPAISEARRVIHESIIKYEESLGIRRPKPAQPASHPKTAPPPPKKVKAPAAPKPPRQPWTWDRLWDTLVSERTLHVMLFLGVALIVAAAISVIILWDTLPQIIQVSSLPLFTIIFYFLGWYIRVKRKLRGSGIALSALASLLVPLDAYAIYLSRGFPREYWAEVWWITSLACLIAYSLTIYLIQTEFFGYLVGIASGSLLCATLQLLGITMEWWQVGLAMLSLIFGLAGELLFRRNDSKWKILAAPLWQLSLVAGAVILLWNLSLGLTTWRKEAAFRLPLALTWWLGGLTFTFAVNRVKSHTFSLATALIYPIAVLLTEAAFFPSAGLGLSWYALGLSLLAPAYFAFGYFSTHPDTEAENKEKDTNHIPGKIVTVVGCLLIIISALWTLSNVNVTTIAHPILALTMLLAKRWWKRPHLLYIVSLLLLTSSAAFIASRGLPLGQISIAWGLLAIILVTAGLRSSHGQEQYTPSALFTSGWLVVLLSLLPTLIFFERGLVVYALGNWTAINGWLALLQHENHLSNFSTWLSRHRYVSKIPFQWLAAFSLPLWAWQTWLNAKPEQFHLPLVFLLLAWLLLGWATWLRRTNEQYSVPWQIVGEICAAITLILALFEARSWMASWFLGLAAYYFTAAKAEKEKSLLWPGSLLFPLGLTLALDEASLLIFAQPCLLALVMLVYLLGGLALERWYGWRRDFLRPLYQSLYPIGLASFIFGLLNVAFHTQYNSWFILPSPDARTMWAAGNCLLLALAFAIRAWMENKIRDSYLAAWLGALACGMVASAYSHGTGRSATLGALAAWAYILIERGLSWLNRGKKLPEAMSVFRTPKSQKLIRYLWRLYRWPLITTAWLISAGTVMLALSRNLILLNGRTPQVWAEVALWLIVGLYAASTWLYYRWGAAQIFAWIAAWLAYIPWTLLLWLLWPKLSTFEEYAVGWTVLAILEWLLGAALIGISGWGQRMHLLQRAHPPQTVAHIILPIALVFSLDEAQSASLALGLGIIFYAACTWLDWRLLPGKPKARYLYPAVFLTPLWASNLLRNFSPEAQTTHYAALLLAFSLPALWIGRWLERRQPAYRLPFYWLTYLILPIGTMLTINAPWALVKALLFCALVCSLSTWLFREPLSIYPATATFALAWMLALNEWQTPHNRLGWGLVVLAILYTLGGWILHQLGKPFQVQGTSNKESRPGETSDLKVYATPLIVAGLTAGIISLFPSSLDTLGTMVGYGSAAALCAFCAFWLRQPIFLTPTTLLTAISYTALLNRWRPADTGLALWLWIAAALTAALWLDRTRGGGQPFPWTEPWRWPQIVMEYIMDWWAFPLYAGAFSVAAFSGLIASNNNFALVNWLLAGNVYGLAIYLFRRRFWLLACAFSLQLAALAGALILQAQFPAWDSKNIFTALLFSPIMWITLFIGLWLQERFKEGAPRSLSTLRGWSRPLFLLVSLNLCLLQAVTFFDWGNSSSWATPTVTLSNTLALILLATWWLFPELSYLALAGGVLALMQRLLLTNAQAWPWWFSLLTVAYGLIGYGLRYWLKNKIQADKKNVNTFSQHPILIWEQPLCQMGWLLSFFSLGMVLLKSTELSSLIIYALFGNPSFDTATLQLVHLIVAVLAVLGIFYLTAGLVEKHRWLAYGAIGLLLTAWSLEWLLIWGQREIQWYVIPTGLYLLGIGYLEWSQGDQGERTLARWLDRAALLILLGSSFWQSLVYENGWRYALLMGLECLLIIWWGSARRLRRILYTGTVGMTLNIIGQLYEPLQSVNRWIVFFTLGTIFVVLASLGEQRLETIKKLSKDMRKQLDEWE